MSYIPPPDRRVFHAILTANQVRLVHRTLVDAADSILDDDPGRAGDLIETARLIVDSEMIRGLDGLAVPRDMSNRVPQGGQL